MLVLPFLLIVVSGLLYTNWRHEQADRRWCELMTILDEQYESSPPATEVGRRFAAAMHTLRGELDC